MPSPTDSQSGISEHMHNITTMLFHKPLETAWVTVYGYYRFLLSYLWSATYTRFNVSIIYCREFSATCALVKSQKGFSPRLHISYMTIP